MTNSELGNKVKPVSRLKQLFHNKAGNTLAMVAAGLVPLTSMIGGGVDASRAYMVRSKLQQACDAGALAGRKALDDPNTAANAETIASNFFRANFPADYLSTTDSAITRMREDDGTFSTTEYNAEADVTLPTTVMHMFGTDEFEISVRCGAIYEVSNSDITMVLDNTGSMAWNSDGSQTSGVPAADQRIKALKDAMISFYDVVDAAADNSSARIRYSFVPYVQTVNVGSLLQQDWIADSHNYQSLLVTTEHHPGELVEHFRSSNSTYVSNCSNYYGTWDGYRVYGELKGGVCVWDDVHAPYDEDIYTYSQRTIDISDFKAGDDVEDPTDRTNNDYSWGGCIEERQTSGDATWSYVSGTGRITGSDGNTPWDLNIDDLPDGTAASQWKPYWPEIVYYRAKNTTSTTSGSSPQVNCPAEAQLLTKMSRGEFVSYTNTMFTGGGTYHDVGLLWGARLSSPDGIFSSNVRETPANAGFVSRHLIFMTDGLLDNGDNLYGLYGIEQHDGRVTGYTNGTSGSAIEADQEARSTSRFLAICEAIKANGIRLWVVQFGVNTGLAGFVDTNANGIHDNLDRCSSNDSAFASGNAAELEANFTEIANTVASLRLAR